MPALTSDPTICYEVEAMDRFDLPVYDARWAPTKAFADWLNTLPQPEKKDRRAAGRSANADRHRLWHEATKANREGGHDVKGEQL